VKKNLAVLTLVLAISLSACAPLTPAAAQLPAETAIDALPISIPTSISTPDRLPTPVSGGSYPAAILQARANLASRLNLPLEQIEVTSFTPKDWPDACLGIPAAQEVCAQVITPGFQVVLVAGTAQYQVHTDVVGKNIRLAADPTLATEGEKPRILLEWTSPACDVLSVSTQALNYGKCGGSLQTVPGFDPGLEPFKNWNKTFAPFEADSPAGKVKFNGLGINTDGLGTIIATPAEQRMIAEWAKLQFDIAKSGRAGAASGLAFGYHREGGIAGFCDDVVVYLDGRAMVSSCKGLNTTFYLTASELQQVYAWFDGLKSIDYSYSDPATADGMKTVLSMPGQGQKSADDASIHAILEFISGLAARASFASQAGPDQAKAGQELAGYFKALNAGDYILGAKLYGGPTDLLQTWNPDIKKDLPAWLERGCKQNGLVCLLARSIRYRGTDSRGGYQFSVEFNNPDGTLFAQGPCCGETSGPTITNFVFAVVPSGGGWQVMDLPPYVP